MAEPYIAERQAANWMSDQIRDMFESAGFELRDWPLTPHLEKQIPADWFFFSPHLVKLFGFQYKTLYQNSLDFWPLDPNQHEILRTHPWIFYCCSELKNIADRWDALRRARLYQPKFAFRPTIPSSDSHPNSRPYIRWDEFYRGLVSCRFGAKVRTEDHLRDLLSPLSGRARIREANQIEELFLSDFNNKIVPTDRTF
jgi:hypothetical protein